MPCEGAGGWRASMDAWCLGEGLGEGSWGSIRARCPPSPAGVAGPRPAHSSPAPATRPSGTHEHQEGSSFPGTHHPLLSLAAPPKASDGPTPPGVWDRASPAAGGPPCPQEALDSNNPVNVLGLPGGPFGSRIKPRCSAHGTLCALRPGVPDPLGSSLHGLCSTLPGCPHCLSGLLAAALRVPGHFPLL